jgi:hypothetical protein
MTPPTKPDEYAGSLIAALKANPNGADAALVARVRKFLDRRLTDAAKGGCHHCHEGESGAPCWWCGLKNRKAR